MEKSPLIQPFAHKERSFKYGKILALVFFLLLFFAVGFWFFYKSIFIENKTENNLFNQAQNFKDTLSFVPSFLGFVRPQTYLVLFLNNTEIRPGGGFIGSYALVKTDHGKIDILQTSGSENLDWAAPVDFKIEPPAPLKKFLKQDRWFFRDSNWSPDFPTSAKTSLWFYRFEGGENGSKIDGVLGLTPTVVEKLMALTGPLDIGGKNFSAENFTDALEYHVEYGYKEEGVKTEDRKSIIKELSSELLKRITSLPPWKWQNLLSLGMDLFKEKQIMIFSNNEDLQKNLERNGWSGSIKKTDSDYLLVVDANLASLKTDPVISRKIIYEIRPEENDYKAKVTITYDHQGSFDWKTTRYRTYTRIYVPEGSRLVSSDGFIDEQNKKVSADTASDLGKNYFGGFLSVEPKTKKTITVEYILPPRITDQIKNSLYTLFVQKQLGSIGSALTVDLNFGKTEGEEKTFFQDTNLTVDREFKIN